MKIKEKNFSEQLAEEKNRLGLTQLALAGLLQISKRTVEHWLAGSKVPLEVSKEGALARLRKRGS